MLTCWPLIDGKMNCNTIKTLIKIRKIIVYYLKNLLEERRNIILLLHTVLHLSEITKITAPQYLSKLFIKAVECKQIYYLFLLHNFIILENIQLKEECHSVIVSENSKLIAKQLASYLFGGCLFLRNCEINRHI